MSEDRVFEMESDTEMLSDSQLMHQNSFYVQYDEREVVQSMFPIRHDAIRHNILCYS